MRALVFSVVLISFGFLPMAFASLGDSDASVELDRGKLNGVHSFNVQKSFTVHEITTPNGISVKEYASSSGKIFAVTWHGFAHPDLQQLMGSYHGEFKDAVSSKPKKFGRSYEITKSKNMIIELGGHMRDVRGKAYIPALLPAGVTAEDIE